MENELEQLKNQAAELPDTHPHKAILLARIKKIEDRAPVEDEAKRKEQERVENPLSEN